MKPLYLITARGGSKGLPGKNIKPLNGKPLLNYTIDFARKFTSDDNIVLSTDAQEILDVAQAHGLKVPFIRPESLASDTAGSREVILHALTYFKERGIVYDSVVLLQPTSPFRSGAHLQKMLEMFSFDIDMVVSVKESHFNPYFSLFEENPEGYLALSKKGNFTRRQDCPKVYAYNGSLYVINAASLQQTPFAAFSKVKKFVMDEIHSVDIDTKFDWLVAEVILEKSLWSNA
ncbi:MAG TPA: acylneuraminate cytidylyltransferase family protein [Chryseosolibacter sp.]